ncbi:amidase domain-containing protein [Streptomyces sp. AV19]|uniref:amidase domain-containing protein n=1 Tax=Streptomyces sp. AV19 TaxID=2793068 RepID=UPI002412F166|nr:amidase domain-containing protein [Streptomyces sp. AV19]MDG4536116.1 amidase domain-containing protein [Streptomyces sp. AV19]
MKSTTLRSAVGVVVAGAVSAVLLPASAAGAATPRAATVDKATADAFGRVAAAVLTERTEALVDGRPARRIAGRTGQKAGLSARTIRTEGDGVSSLRTRKKRLAALGEVYTAGDTKVSVDGVRVTGARATVRVTETTTFRYKKIRGDEPATTGFKAHHELGFTAAKGGRWELTGIKATDDGPRAVNAPAPAPARTAGVATTTPDAPKASTSWPVRAVPKKRTSYNYAAMAAYSEKYWRNYNPAYRKFNEAGGDCTNFLSQALKAGGWKPETGGSADYRKWWYENTRQSDSWIGVNEWSWYALNSKRVTPLSNVFQMEVGDVLQMDFDGDGAKDHSMMTTYRSGYGMPYLTYHSTNTYRKSMASILASYPDAVYFAYRT